MKAWLWVAVLAVVLVLVQGCRYNMCRDEGLSRTYCAVEIG